MTDDDPPVSVTIRPAVPIDPGKATQAMDLPSRKVSGLSVKTGEPAVVSDAGNSEGGTQLPNPIKTERLSEDEIKRLNEQRKANIRKKQMGRPPGSKNKPKEIISSRVRIASGTNHVPPKRDRHEPAETAPESPMELLLFHGIMLNLESASQETRKRIIAALVHVYP